MILKIFYGAITGMVVSIAVPIILIAIATTISGVITSGPVGIISGPLSALYFAGTVIIYVGPLGLVTGAIGGTFLGINSLTSTPIGNHENQLTVQVSIWRKIGVSLLAGLLLALIIQLASIPYTLTNVTREVKHAVTWTYDTGKYSECLSTAVILILEEYPNIEVVCSPEIANYLDSYDGNIVPIIYRVTYDFGEVRSYQLIKVGPIPVEWSEWLGGPSGCGGQYHPPCGSPKAQRGSPLYQSSWPDDETSK